MISSLKLQPFEVDRGQGNRHFFCKPSLVKVAWDCEHQSTCGCGWEPVISTKRDWWWNWEPTRRYPSTSWKPLHKIFKLCVMFCNEGNLHFIHEKIALRLEITYGMITIVIVTAGKNVQSMDPLTLSGYFGQCYNISTSYQAILS